MESKMSNYWVVGMCVLAVSVGVWWWNRRMGRRGIPKGNLGWPWIGETLDFISSGYSSNPVSFMQKRQSLYVSIPNCTSLLRGSIASTRNHCSCMLLYIPHSYIDIYVCIIIDKFLAAAPLCMSLISSSLFFYLKVWQSVQISSAWAADHSFYWCRGEQIGVAERRKDLCALLSEVCEPLAGWNFHIEDQWECA